MRDKRVSSKDVAREAGVSQATVSYVLNNNPNVKIRPETRQAVIEAARRLNYHVDYIARNMRLRKSASIAIVNNLAMSSYVSMRALEGIKASLVERNYSVTICFGSYTDIQDAEFIKYYYSNLVDGIIFVFCDLKQADITFLENHRIPYVTINANTQPFARFQIKTDMKPAVSDAAAHLKEKGCGSIGFLGQFAGDEKSMRFSSYRAAMREHNMRVQNRFVFHVANNEQTMEEEIAARLNGAKLPHALFCDNVNAGFHTLRYMQMNNIKVPDEISLVILGTNTFSKRVYPAFTAVEAPLYTMGYRGSELLFDIMESEYKTHSDAIVLQWQFVARESS